MNSNTSTLSGPGASPAGAPAGPGGLPAGPQGGLPAGLERLAAAVGEFAADDLDQLGDALLAAQVVALDRLAGQLDAVRLRLLAVVDARGAGGAEQGGCAPSTQAWLRAACRLSAAAAGQRVRTARAPPAATTPAVDGCPPPPPLAPRRPHQPGQPGAAVPGPPPPRPRRRLAPGPRPG